MSQGKKVIEIKEEEELEEVEEVEELVVVGEQKLGNKLSMRINQTN